MSFGRGSKNPEGYPVSDSGPVLGPGWWYLIVILFLAAGMFGFWIIVPGLTASEDAAGRRIAMALLLIGALPLLITIVQAVRLFRRLGRAKLYVPHPVLPLGFSGTVTYLRPLRGGATIEQIEVRLQCEEVLQKGSGKNKRTYKKVVYDEPITPGDHADDGSDARADPRPDPGVRSAFARGLSSSDQLVGSSETEDARLPEHALFVPGRGVPGGGEAMIRIEVKDSVRCGEDLVGQAVWNSGGGKEPRRVLVECRWRIEGKGVKNEQSIDEVVTSDVGGKSQVTVPFRFSIHGPPSYEGKLFRVVWEVVVRADLPWAIDEVETRVVLVQPELWSPEDFENYENAMNDLDSDEEDDEEDDSIPAGP